MLRSFYRSYNLSIKMSQKRKKLRIYFTKIKRFLIIIFFNYFKCKNLPYNNFI